MDIFQLLVSGISQGCVYGLIALGFVLIYKATEMVNFAQGDMMMLGAYVAFTYINLLGLPFFWGFLATVLTMALVGMVIERADIDCGRCRRIGHISAPSGRAGPTTITLGELWHPLDTQVLNPKPSNS